MHKLHDPSHPAAETIGFDAFLAVDIRVGTIERADHPPLSTGNLLGRQVAAVVNFAPRQIGPFMSEVLTLGFPDADGEVVLFAPDQAVPKCNALARPIPDVPPVISTTLLLSIVIVDPFACRSTYIGERL